MVSYEYQCLQKLIDNNKPNANLRKIILEFFDLNENEYKNFVEKYNFNLDEAKAFDNIQDKISYILVEEYLRSRD